MKTLDWTILTSLIFLAAFIWFRDSSWLSSSEDTLPILIGLPLFYWMGRPWQLTRPLHTLPTLPLLVFAGLFLLGIALNSTLLLTVAWTYALWSWLRLRTDPEGHSRLLKLMVLPFMSFPWITLDAQAVGWWFRLSGAKATGALYSLLGLDVKVEGTNLLINGLPISVEAACSGLNTLQSMLIAGSLLAFLYLGDTSRYWINLLLLVVIAWIANTLRIVMISALALTAGPEVALGIFHTIGGWVVVLLMFLLSWGLFSLQEPRSSKAAS